MLSLKVLDFIFNGISEYQLSTSCNVPLKEIPLEGTLF